MFDIAHANEAIMVTAASTARWYGDTGLPSVPLPGIAGSTAVAARRADDDRQLVTDFITAARTTVERLVSLVPDARLLPAAPAPAQTEA